MSVVSHLSVKDGEKKSFQQEKQQWVQQNEELKEEWKQQQQKIHNLDQQLQEKSKEKRCLEERNEVLMQGIVPLHSQLQ